MLACEVVFRLISNENDALTLIFFFNFYFSIRMDIHMSLNLFGF